MVHLPGLLALGAFCVHGLAAPLEPQAPFDVPRPKLQGRFLHVTDMHPDPFYRPGTASTGGKACHRGEPTKPKKASGYYGTSYSKCDSPFMLTNYTLDFLDENWADEIDFVIWTGDSARHDNDRKRPRTTEEIYGLNRGLATRMEEIFTRRGIPVVPSLGNNDVYPHNIMQAGPNSITHEFSTIWRAFVPFSSYQVFQRGGYYSIDVIQDSIAAVSLNTMYFFYSNKAVNGCEFVEKDDPGNLQFDWLEVQLAQFRARGMKVWLTGHVPPSSSNYWPECYVKYTEISLRYQDTILGHLYGHMNADHFSFLEAGTLNLPNSSSDAQTPRMSSNEDLFESLIEDFARLPKASKANHDNYAVVNVAPAVVPNPYLPSFRVFSYNITGVRGTSRDGYQSSRKNREIWKEECKKVEHRNTWKCHLDQPWHSDPTAPSRMNGLFTPLGYAQYYIPATQLRKASAKRKPKWTLEYLTYPLELLRPAGTETGEGEFIYPIPLRHLPGSIRDNSTISRSRYAPYKMVDLTVGSWMGLARKGGARKGVKIRERFREYMFQGGE